MVNPLFVVTATKKEVVVLFKRFRRRQIWTLGGGDVPLSIRSIPPQALEEALRALPVASSSALRQSAPAQIPGMGRVNLVFEAAQAEGGDWRWQFLKADKIAADTFSAKADLKAPRSR